MAEVTSPGPVENVRPSRLLEQLEHGARWCLARPPILLALLVNVVFLFLPFYDANNVPLSLSITSHFVSTYPAFTYDHWVAGIYIFTMFVPGHLAFLASGNQLYATYTIYKVLYFGLALWMTWAFYLVFRPLGERLALWVAVFVLANPLWIFVSYVWVNYDMVPVAFLAVGYIVLRYAPGPASDTRRLLLAAALISVSVFFYWFALAIVPTLIFYSSTWRDRLKLTAVFAAVLGATYAATVFLFSGGLAAYTSTLVGSNTTYSRADFFGLEYYLHLAGVDYYLLVAGLVLVMPVVLRALGVSEAATALIVLTFFVFSSPIPTPDNYLFAFPFAVLAWKEFRVEERKFRWLWALLAYPVVGLVLVNFYIGNAEPDGMGVFYFGYQLYPNNIRFVQTTAQIDLYLMIFNLSTLAAITLTFTVLAIFSPRSRANARMGPPPELPAPPSPSPSGGRPASLRRRRTAAAVVASLAVLAVLALLFNASVPNLIVYNGSGTAPVYLLTPHYLPNTNNVPRPIPGQSFALEGPTTYIPTTAPPLEFARWLGPVALNLSARISLAGEVPPESTVLDSLPFHVYLLNESAPFAGVASVGTAPPSTGAAAAGAPTNFSVGASAWGNGTCGFRFYPENASYAPALVVRLWNSSEQFLLVRNLNSTYAELASTGGTMRMSPRYFAMPATIPYDEWNYLLFGRNAKGFGIDLNGYRAVLPAENFGVRGLHGQALYSAYPTSATAARAEYGYIGAVSCAAAFPVTPQYGYAINMSGTWVNGTLPSPTIDLTLESDAAGSTLTINGRSFHDPLNTSYVGWGKYVAAPYSVTVTIETLTLTQFGPNNYYLVPVFAAAVVPPVLGVVSILYLRRRFPRPPPTNGDGGPSGPR